MVKAKASDASNDGVSRRSLLKGVPMVAGLALSFGAAALPDSAVAQTKVSHEIAKYQDQPKNGQKCSTCTYFEAPASCKLVADPISPDGWCQFYAAKSPS